MSAAANNIPFEIQEEIIKRVVSVKSLIRFRSVSKQWKSLIDSSEFITCHSINQNHQHRILLRHKVDSEYKYVSIVDDDDSFPQHKFSPIVSPTVKLGSDAVIIGCSHGLVCLYGFDRDTVGRKKPLIVVWNPSIRKFVGIALIYNIPRALGFGVCPKTFAPKIVIITGGHDSAMVFTLTSGDWRSIAMNLPNKPRTFSRDSSVVIDGVIYWFDLDLIANNVEEPPYHRYRIISFDLTNEEFGEVDLPENLSLAGPRRSMDICKLKESLVVLDYYYRSNDAVCDVWMLVENGSSFIKLFTVVKVSPFSIIGFRENGQPIVDRVRKLDGYHKTLPASELQVYEPVSEHKNGLGIYGWDFNMASYTESLLLLNHRSPT